MDSGGGRRSIRIAGSGHYREPCWSLASKCGGGLYCQERSLSAASVYGEQEMTMTKLALAIAFLMAATMYAQAQSWGMARRTGLTHQD